MAKWGPGAVTIFVIPNSSEASPSSASLVFMQLTDVGGSWGSHFSGPAAQRLMRENFKVCSVYMCSFLSVCKGQICRKRNKET